MDDKNKILAKSKRDKDKSAGGKLEEYERLKKELELKIKKKMEIDSTIASIEDDIYDKEQEYLSESTYGNIIKGFDNFTKNSSVTNVKKKLTFSDEDRIFSLSSITYVKLLKKAAEDDDDDDGGSGNAKKRKRDL